MLFDTHAHLDQDEFQPDRAEVLDRAKAAGVSFILCVGVGADSSQKTIQLAEQHVELYAAVGIQPNYCAQAQPGDWEKIVELARHPKVKAIGETGLDRYWDYTPFEVQQDYFARHLRLAAETRLPFIVHTRESDADVLAMLRQAQQEFGTLQGVMHSFTGTAETAAECVALGLYISFAGMATFKKSHDLRTMAGSVPADRILLETDSPYLSPHPLRGRRNEPAHIVHTCACLAEVRGLTPDVFAAQTTENARRLFNV